MLDYFLRDREYLLNEYEHNIWQNGVSQDVLIKETDKIKNTSSGKSVQEIKSLMIEYILTNAQVEVNENSLFADKINHMDIMESFKQSQKEIIKEDMELPCKYKDFEDAFVFTGDVDFSHTCPDWETVLGLGLVGILSKIQNKLSGISENDKEYEFYTSLERVYKAAVIYVTRLADEAEEKYALGKNENMRLIADSLKNLSADAPKTLHEALELIFIYYTLQQHLDATNVRSLGGLDTLLYPFYESDIKKGILCEKEVRVLLKYFMAKMSAKKAIANIPFYLCGRDNAGNDLTTGLTHIILEEYIALGIDDPKIHIRWHENTDKKVAETVLKSIREGKNSFVFMNDDIVEKGLIKIGASPLDARKYTIIGCYEPAASGEVPCSCAGRINIAHIVMLTLTNGIDLLSQKQLLEKDEHPIYSFEDFFERLKRNIKYISKASMDLISEYERNYPKIHSSPFFSSTFEECINKGADVYEGSAKYNNSSVCAFGLATAVDSLLVIKKAVFEEKILSLRELTDILSENWEGSEGMRMKFANLYPKYGNNNEEADKIMLDICREFEKAVNGKPNGRNGVFRLGLFSIDWRHFFGESTPATPDGRFAGSTISKNLCAVLGCDREGVTSLINSVAKIDHTNVPNGGVLDVLLHYSAVSGDAGFMSLMGLMTAYFKKGGSSIQFNVLNPEELKRAQENPEKYKTLQVRLCGWNVYFVDLSKEEQDEFIRQTEHMGA